jgi:hypothetical protein
LLLLASFRVSQLPCLAPFNGFDFGSGPQRRSKDRTINFANPDDDDDDGDDKGNDTVASRLTTVLLVPMKLKLGKHLITHSFTISISIAAGLDGLFRPAS